MTTPLEQYIAKYCKDIAFVPGEHIAYEISGTEVTADTFVYDGGNWGAEKAHLTLRKNGAVYACVCIDQHDWKNLLFPVTLGGQDYLIFRKTLYGFTLVNADTLEEAYDCFPAEVLDEEEAYIFTYAASFDDLIIFDGCFWGSPYFYTVYDHASGRSADLYHALGVESTDTVPVIENGILTLTCSTQNGDITEMKFSSGDLRRLLCGRGTTES